VLKRPPPLGQSKKSMTEAGAKPAGVRTRVAAFIKALLLFGRTQMRC
jgi:hypothetical protein